MAIYLGILVLVYAFAFTCACRDGGLGAGGWFLVFKMPFIIAIAPQIGLPLLGCMIAGFIVHRIVMIPVALFMLRKEIAHGTSNVFYDLFFKWS